MGKVYPANIHHLKGERKMRLVGHVVLKKNHTEHGSEEVWIALGF